MIPDPHVVRETLCWRIKFHQIKRYIYWVLFHFPVKILVSLYVVWFLKSKLYIKLAWPRIGLRISSESPWVRNSSKHNLFFILQCTLATIRIFSLKQTLSIEIYLYKQELEMKKLRAFSNVCESSLNGTFWSL